MIDTASVPEWAASEGGVRYVHSAASVEVLGNPGGCSPSLTRARLGSFKFRGGDLSSYIFF